MIKNNKKNQPGLNMGNFKGTLKNNALYKISMLFQRQTITLHIHTYCVMSDEWRLYDYFLERIEDDNGLNTVDTLRSLLEQAEKKHDLELINKSKIK